MNPQKDATGTRLKSLLAAWITMIFGTSALLYLASPINFRTYSENQLLNFFYSTWEIADEVGPVVKLSIIALFALLVSIADRLVSHKTWIRYGVSAGLAVLTTVVVLGFLPENYSRGFGIGLTGSRFDHQTLRVYLIGSILGGLVYTYALQRHQKRSA
ncbi:hypothetical protein [Spirosoma rigui]|uniref:hypothetical protein n=1 Tax=Spirosoma rigui TaxID=564064 RepID=UPI0009B031BD|nr:hypothetical protein [Spirosoma rigui]